MFNKSINPLYIPSLSKEQLTFSDFLQKKFFNWKNKNIQILVASAHKSKNANYLAFHTNHSVFYLEDGVQWLQETTGIYVEHEDDETHKWLLQCAFDRIQEDILPVNINSLSLHHYVNTNKYQSILLKGMFNSCVYASTKDWINFFSTLKFNQLSSFDISEICLRRNIILGNQHLSYSQYTKLRSGNVILLNNTNFNLDGAGLLSFGNFVMDVVYDDNGLLFQTWKTNMKDKHEQLEDWNFEEEQDASLDEYLAEDEDEIEEDDTQEEYTHNEQHQTIHEEIDEEAQIENTQEQTHPFADIPVKLTFSLGQVNLSVAQIMQLQQGSVLQLEKTTPAQVEIYANNKRIGSGEVVEVEGMLAVQINHLN
jgi:flagellar motor switch protein FliN/FliY